MVERLEEIKPKVSEFETAGGIVRSVEYPVLTPVQQGLYVSKDDWLVIQFLGMFEWADYELIARIFVPEQGVQTIRRRIGTATGYGRQLQYVPLTEGWLTNVTISPVDFPPTRGEVEVWLGIQRGWVGGEFPILWFARGYIDFYRWFSWPINDHIEPNPLGKRVVWGDANVQTDNWGFTIDKDLWHEIDGLYLEITPGDSSPQLGIRVEINYMNQRAVTLDVPAVLDSQDKWYISLIPGYPGWYKQNKTIHGPLPIVRPLYNYEGLRVRALNYTNLPTFNVIACHIRIRP